MDQNNGHRGGRFGFSDEVRSRMFRDNLVKATGPGIIATDIIIFILNFGGLFLNLLVFYILLIRIRILKIDTVLSGITTIFDIVASVTMIIRIMIKWTLLAAYYPINEQMLCKSTGVLFFASTISAFDIVSTLGLIRCLIIVFNFKLRSVFWGIILSILIVFNWVGSILWDWSSPEMSWGGFCQWNGRKSGFGGGYHNVDRAVKARRDDRAHGPGKPQEPEFFGEIETIKAVIMLIIICISYVLIFRFYRKYYDNIKRSSSTDQHLINEIGTQKNKTSLKLLLLILSYVVIYIPKFAIFIIYNFTETNPSQAFELVSAILYTMSTIVNASVLLFIQEETKQELQLLWTLVFHRAKTVLK